MLERQLQKLSDAEHALSNSGVSKLIFFSKKVNRSESKFSKASRDPLSSSLNIKMNVALDKKSLLSKPPMYSKHASNIHELRFKNRTLTEKDLQNSSDSLASKPLVPLRPFSGRQA